MDLLNLKNAVNKVNKQIGQMWKHLACFYVYFEMIKNADTLYKQVCKTGNVHLLMRLLVID